MVLSFPYSERISSRIKVETRKVFLHENKAAKTDKSIFRKEFGKPKGNSLLEEQEKILGTLIENIKNKSKNQKKTLVQTILPGIALYKALVQKTYRKKRHMPACRNICLVRLGRTCTHPCGKWNWSPAFTPSTVIFF